MKRTVKKHFALLLAFIVLLVSANDMYAKEKKKGKEDGKDDSKKEEALFNGLKWRSIGPAMTSGRIADFAVNPDNHSEWFVGVASGHVWKTVNNGTTFEPVFDSEAVYSIGAVTMDPNNHNVIWVGTGENNHQRALGYGDGVYKSSDGGKSWNNMGLENSRQIGDIVVDPRNSNVVFVAAEGSAWGPGGDRGLYKTVDGGKSWRKVLEISEETGVNNVAIDPVEPDIMYATSEQRRRHVFTKIGGGPESAFYRSEDGGETWEKSMSGLPSEDIGGMGLAVSPVDHNVVYLIVEAAYDKGGFFRSTDRGVSWVKRSDYSSSGQYYNEIYCDPVDVDKVYSMETYSMVTMDAGKTWKAVGNDNRHVDDHALWIDPDDTKHLFIGGDGGVYETFDGGDKFQFKTNLPVTQFYRVNVDNDYPFYNVYGGTQDNNTLMGPSGNQSEDGVTSEEWKSILGGDGFWVAADRENPNIVYCEYQYGNSYRYDKATGETFSIKPRPRNGEDTYKWNWNAPLVTSLHNPARIYAMANKLFRSDDRGDSWEVISEDLTSGMDRNSWPVMGHYWSYDAVVKDVSTSLFGTGVSFAESPLDENLLYTGTDDGVLGITEDGGRTWRKVSSFPGIPEYTYISDILADRFDVNTVYVTFDNRKRDDFKPYVLRSGDKGKTWTSVAGTLPDNQTVHTMVQDRAEAKLLFVGTEFGCYYTIDGGSNWEKLGTGLPSIAVRDMVIQERENDLVLATFGRGFYILDDYSALREYAENPAIKESDAHIFSIADSRMFNTAEGKYGQGSDFFKASNEKFGAAITYYVKDVPKTLKEERKEKEKELFEAKKPIPQPDENQLKEEQFETAPFLVFTIYDESGEAVRRLSASASKGVNRINWDFRCFYPAPVNLEGGAFNSGSTGRPGLMALPGEYSISLDMVAKGKVTRLSEPVALNAVPLNWESIPVENREALYQFQQKLVAVAKDYMGMDREISTEITRVLTLKQAVLNTPSASLELMNGLAEAEKELKEIKFAMEGPEAKASWEELPPMHMPLNRRLNVAVRTHWSSAGDLNKTVTDQYEIIKQEMIPLENRLKVVKATVDKLESGVKAAGAGWTP